MIPSLTIDIPGQPIPKGRGRAVRRGASVRVVTPERTRDFEAGVAMIARAAARVAGWAADPLDALACEIWATMARPQRRGASAPSLHVVRPDADNIAKAVLDGLVLGGLIRDEQVCDLLVRKRYAAPGEEPGVRVRIWGVMA